MKLWFSVTFFIFSLAFTLYGLNTLDVLNHMGRPGPGYFPLIVGVLLILSTGINCVKDLSERIRLKKESLAALGVSSEGESTQAVPEEKVYIKDTVVVIALITLSILLLNQLGSILSMIVFMFIFLSYFNRGKLIHNIIYTILLPLSVHFLFDVWLRAGLPRGLFGYF